MQILSRIILSITLILCFLVSAAPVLAETQLTVAPSAIPGTFVEDSEVTFVGKNAKRSGDLLDWVVANYQWSSVTGYDNTFVTVWRTIAVIVFALNTIAIVVAAFVIIITRGQSLSAKKFIIRFIITTALIVISLALVQFIYQIFDIIQGFFLRFNGSLIQSKDLLSVAFDYKNFVGLRVAGMQYDESAFISLLMVKLTAASYYAMFMILMIRKIILWFFIVISPIFPILLLFTPLRNSAKVWIGEFFRWVLYGPLFAVLLAGLVTFWQGWNADTPLNLSGQINNPPAGYVQTASLPCGADPDPGSEVYPTAINILIGGPCQKVSKDNNLNLPTSFIQYVVALIMIWMVILLPFLLLNIFLDYFSRFSFTDSNVAKMLTNSRIAPTLERYGFSPKPRSPDDRPKPSLSSGRAMQIPAYEKMLEGVAAEQSVNESFRIGQSESSNIGESERSSFNVGQTENSNIGESNSVTSAIQSSIDRATEESKASTERVTSAIKDSAQSMQGGVISNLGSANVSDASEVLKLSNLSVPKMSDIAKYETSLLSADSSSRASANSVYEILGNISNPSQTTDSNHYSAVTTSLVKEAVKGNHIASAVLSASMAATKFAESPKARLDHYSDVASASNIAADVSIPTESRFEKVKQELSNKANKGNIVATAILSAAPPPSGGPDSASKSVYLNQYQALAKAMGSISTPGLSDEDKLKAIAKNLEAEAKMNNPLAVSVVSVLTLLSEVKIPDSNELQKVNLDEYESVRSTWVENYSKMETLPNFPNRSAWIQSDIDSIPKAVNLMVSQDPREQEAGKNMVSKILPFLLLGGFSKAEIVAYLKAKLQAAKQVLAETKAKESTEEFVERKAEAKPKSMELATDLDGKNEESKTIK